MFNDVSGQNGEQNVNVAPSKLAGSASVSAPTLKDLDIYVMPGKFLPAGPKKQSGSGTKVIIIAAILVAMVIAGIAGAIMYLNANINKGGNTNNIAVTNTSNANQVINQVPSNNAQTNDLQNQITNHQNDNNLNNAITNNSNSVPSNDIPPITLTNLDSDNDMLTVDEEALFLTNLAKDDSDRDGYKDGQEIINLFNPLVPGQTLENSGLVTKYNNDNFRYSLLIPKSWVPSPSSTDKSEVMFLSNSETGEFMIIKVSTNTNGQSLTALASTYFVSGVQTENFSLGGQPALRTKTKVLMVTAQYIYVIEYDLNQSPQVHFPTVFEMMLKSFQLTKAEVVNVEP